MTHFTTTDEKWKEVWTCFCSAFQVNPEWKTDNEPHYRIEAERFSLSMFLDAIDIMRPTIDTAGTLPSVAKCVVTMKQIKDRLKANDQHEKAKVYIADKDDRNTALNKMGFVATRLCLGMLTTNYTGNMNEQQRIGRWTMPQVVNMARITGDKNARPEQRSVLDSLVENWQRYGDLQDQWTAESYTAIWADMMPTEVMNTFRTRLGLAAKGEAA